MFVFTISAIVYMIVSMIILDVLYALSYYSKRIKMGSACKCLRRNTLWELWNNLWDELVELFQVKNWQEFQDEFSDVCWSIGRFRSEIWLRLLWFVRFSEQDWLVLRFINDGKFYKKCMNRFQTHACIRSARHLKNGKCPLM
jgi:hypothetical protein